MVICYPAPELIYDIRFLNTKSAKHHKFSCDRTACQATFIAKSIHFAAKNIWIKKTSQEMHSPELLTICFVLKCNPGDIIRYKN
ncbi:helix-turn-helix domain-containing protein [Coprococcus eutactus]|uniref:helix-turn-helix domain-containing protein n=1 Tax=Coprococcus eutactus TaxID=33043 RepID=UPI0012DE3557|nr:helix-turn-helix domain-containing protein [Coprococcus eutactus]UEA79676.1 helix-turn-helix transcriptional regulator [Coprococcus eutactus ATCC 27759]